MLTCELIILEMKTEITVFLRIIARGDYFLFLAKRGDYSREGDYSRKAIISTIAYWKSCSKDVCFFYFQKNNHIKQTEHGLFKCSKFSSLISFQSLNRH